LPSHHSLPLWENAPGDHSSQAFYVRGASHAANPSKTATRAAWSSDPDDGAEKVVPCCNRRIAFGHKETDGGNWAWRSGDRAGLWLSISTLHVSTFSPGVAPVFQLRQPRSLGTQNADPERTSRHTCLTLQWAGGGMPIQSLLPYSLTTNVDVKDFQRPGVPVAGTRFIYGAPLFLRKGDTQTPIKLRGWASFIRGWFVGRHAISEHVLRVINECMPKQNSRGEGEWVGG